MKSFKCQLTDHAFYFCETPQEFEQKVLRRFGVDDDVGTMGGCVYNRGLDTWMFAVTTSNLVHESVHAASALMESVGIKDEEFRAFATQMIFDKFSKFVKIQ